MAAKVVGRLEALAAPHLEGGERVVSGVRVNQKGTALAIAGFGVVGAGVAHARSKGSREAQASVGVPARQQMAFALTDRRLLVFSRGALSGRPKEYLGSIPLDQITAAEFEDGKIVPKLYLSFGNDARSAFEAVKIDKPAEFAGALQDALAARAA